MFDGYSIKIPLRNMQDTRVKKSPADVGERIVLSYGGLASELSTFGDQTEQQFMKVAGWLADFHVRATSVSGHAFKASEMMASHESASIFDGFQELLEEMEGQIKEIEEESRNSGRLLVRMSDLLRTLHEPVREFRKIVKALQAIGFTTRIESGVSGRDVGDFSGLALDIKRLSEIINARSTRVLDDVTLLEQEVIGTIRKMEDLQGWNSERVHKRIAHARQIILSLVENRGRVAGMAEFLSRKSSEVASHIGEIVSSVQFHDITRQKVEHVRTTLENLDKELRLESENGHKDHQLALAAEVCRLQKNQLQNAKDELEGAVFRIVSSLHELSEAISMIVQETMKVSGAADRDNITIFSEMEPVLDYVRQVLSSASDVNRQSLELVASVVSRIADMSFMIDEIELIGSEMKVVASNAGIRAAHAGIRGASLGVISNAIQNLSGEALFQTTALAKEFREISAQASKLNDVLNEGHRKREASISSLGVAGEGQLESLKRINADFLLLLKRMKEEAEELAGDVHVAASSLNVHHTVCRLIDGAIDGLNGVLRDVGEKSFHPEISGNRIFSDMMARYTMQSEREVHLRDVPNSPPLGETPLEEEGGTHGLGLNVELF